MAKGFSFIPIVVFLIDMPAGVQEVMIRVTLSENSTLS